MDSLLMGVIIMDPIERYNSLIYNYVAARMRLVKS
jgi:hypothetical protein